MYSFPNLKPVCCFMFISVTSWPAYRFLRRQVRWSGIPITLRIFHSLLWSTQSKASAYSMTFFYILPIFRWSNGCCQFDLWFLCLFSKSSLNIWKFRYCCSLAWRILSITLLDRVWDEFSCMVVWPFFGIAFIWDWNENWPFPVLWPMLSFPYLLAYWMHYSQNILF